MPAKLLMWLCDHIIISFHLSRAFALYIAHGETKRDFLEFVHLRIAHSFLDRFPRYSLHSSISTSFHKFTYLNSNFTAAIKSNSYGRKGYFSWKLISHQLPARRTFNSQFNWLRRPWRHQTFIIHTIHTHTNWNRN